MNKCISNFIIRNLDSIIISTIFFFLGILPAKFSFDKKQNSDISPTSMTLNKTNNNYKQNITYNTHNQNTYNTKSTIMINHVNSNNNNDDVLDVFVLGIILIILILSFYKNFNKIFPYYYSIIIANIAISGLLMIYIYKIKKHINIHKNFVNILARNTLSWIAICIILGSIYFNINYSSDLKNFRIFVENTYNKPVLVNTSEFIAFTINNISESLMVIFISISFILCTYLILKLIKSHIWIISYIQSFNQTNNKFLLKFWNKIYKKLNTQESKLNYKFWIFTIMLSLVLTTGLLPFIITLPYPNN